MKYFINVEKNGKFIRGLEFDTQNEALRFGSIHKQAVYQKVFNDLPVCIGDFRE